MATRLSIERWSLRYVEPAENSRKFYRVFRVTEESRNFNGVFYHFGRIGTAGQVKTETFDDSQDAHNQALKKVHEKLSPDKGYDEVEPHAEFVVQSEVWPLSAMYLETLYQESKQQGQTITSDGTPGAIIRALTERAVQALDLDPLEAVATLAGIRQEAEEVRDELESLEMILDANEARARSRYQEANA